MKTNALPRLAASLAFALAVPLAQAQTVVLYSSNNTETIDIAVDVAKKIAPKLTVQQVTGGTGALMKRIQCGWACIRTGYACDPISACRCREDFDREVKGER